MLSLNNRIVLVRLFENVNKSTLNIPLNPFHIMNCTSYHNDHLFPSDPRGRVWPILLLFRQCKFNSRFSFLSDPIVQYLLFIIMPTYSNSMKFAITCLPTKWKMAYLFYECRLTLKTGLRKKC